MSDINRLLCNAKTAAEVRKYLAQGADIDNTSGPLWGTPLICASRSGYFEVVQALIQAGANLTRKDHANRSALDVARER